jgi:hypothetical protein
MKSITLLTLIVAVLPEVYAADKKKAAEPTVTYQTMPNSTSRDYSKPSFVTQNGVT